MEFQTITYRRPARNKIALSEVPGLLKLRQQGESLRQLQQRAHDELGIDVSTATISRMLKRAEAASA